MINVQCRPPCSANGAIVRTSAPCFDCPLPDTGDTDPDVNENPLVAGGDPLVAGDDPLIAGP